MKRKRSSSGEEEDTVTEDLLPSSMGGTTEDQLPSSMDGTTEDRLPSSMDGTTEDRLPSSMDGTTEDLLPSSMGQIAVVPSNWTIREEQCSHMEEGVSTSLRRSQRVHQMLSKRMGVVRKWLVYFKKKCMYPVFAVLFTRMEPLQLQG